MQAPVYNAQGETVGEIELDESVFGVAFNEAVVHQALVRQLANARVGTASTKTRGKVSGSTRKLYRQKHTGLARAGSRRSPIRRGGGIIFGPHPRSYRQQMPKRMRHLALRCVLSAKVADGELKVVEGFGLEQPKTKEMVRILNNLGVDGSALLVSAQSDAVLVRSARNIGAVKTLPANLLNVGDLLSHRLLVMTTEAVKKVEELWGQRARGDGVAPR